MSDLPEAVPDGEGGLLLDPFAVHRLWASRIPGLGGSEPAPDPGYVFLTGESRPAIGRVCATVRFRDLAATHGTFVFEIRARSIVPGAEHSRLQTITVGAADLARTGGVVELCFESYRNIYYAIACSINDETDAVASDVAVSIDRAMPGDHGREWEWLHEKGIVASRGAGIEPALVHGSLTDLVIPTLADVVSQIATPAQCREPAFSAAMDTLGREPEASFDNWSLAYVLQAVERFSGHDQGRMLGYGAHRAPLLSHFASRGCDVLAMDHVPDRAVLVDPGQELHRLWVSELCSEANFFRHAHYTTSYIQLPSEPFRDQFDVLWSISANRLMTPQEFVYFVVNGLVHVKPGGLAVHVFDYVEGLADERQDPYGTSLTRQEIERIAALGMSWKHDVARLRFQHGARLPDEGTSLPFGIVLLRGYS